MRKRNEGLKKRCACPRRLWAKCSHPWHFGFHHAGKEHRVSLNKVANKPAGYRMSKSEAEALRDTLRAQIREGSFLDPSAAATITLKDERITFGDVVDRYLEHHVRTPSRRPGALKVIEYNLKTLRLFEVRSLNGAKARLEDKSIDAITTADVDEFRLQRRRNAPGEIGTNRLLARLRHVFNWAIGKGLVDRTPFMRNGVAVVTLEKEDPRGRRLQPGEEEKLLGEARPHLYALIVAALETGCRIGELLSMQWSQVDLNAGVITLPAVLTKTKRERAFPITRRLAAVLEMRRVGPDGYELRRDDYVFGNEVGEKAKSIKTAWKLALERAGIADLHFHDLRREFASRLLESPGVAGHEVRDWLGHTSIVTTNRYLASTVGRLKQAADKFEQSRILRTNFAQKQVEDAKEEAATKWEN